MMEVEFIRMFKIISFSAYNIAQHAILVGEVCKLDFKNELRDICIL